MRYYGDGRLLWRGLGHRLSSWERDAKVQCQPLGRIVKLSKEPMRGSGDKGGKRERGSQWTEAGG